MQLLIRISVCILEVLGLESLQHLYHDCVVYSVLYGIKSTYIVFIVQCSFPVMEMNWKCIDLYKFIVFCSLYSVLGHYMVYSVLYSV